MRFRSDDDETNSRFVVPGPQKSLQSFVPFLLSLDASWQEVVVTRSRDIQVTSEERTHADRGLLVDQSRSIQFTFDGCSMICRVDRGSVTGRSMYCSRNGRGTVEERSRNVRGAAGNRSRSGRGTVEDRSRTGQGPVGVGRWPVEDRLRSVRGTVLARSMHTTGRGVIVAQSSEHLPVTSGTLRRLPCLSSRPRVLLMERFACSVQGIAQRLTALLASTDRCYCAAPCFRTSS